MSRRITKYLKITICTAINCFEEYFPNGEPLKDAVSWMKDTYGIEQDHIVSTTISYITYFKKTFNDGND